MEPREAITIVMKIRSKYTSGSEEDQALLLAAGVLDSAALSKNRIRGILKKRNSKIESPEGK